jgi:hypothetical protein
MKQDDSGHEDLPGDPERPPSGEMNTECTMRKRAARLVGTASATVARRAIRDN